MDGDGDCEVVGFDFDLDFGDMIVIVGRCVVRIFVRVLL